MDAKANTQSVTEHTERHFRTEDDVLIRGLGRYVADAPLPNQACAYFVRSPHAFARILRIDTAAAEKAARVMAVFGAKDMGGGAKCSPPPAARGPRRRQACRFAPSSACPRPRDACRRS